MIGTDLPLHPLVVHLPLALAVLVPVLAALALVLRWRGAPSGHTAWALVAALQGLLVLGAWVALRSGQNEEETVEAIVAESVLEHHEEAAEIFLGGAAGVLVLAVLALLVPATSPRRLLMAMTLAGMVLGAVLAVRVGEAGGALVYRHGAAAAYSTSDVGEPEGALGLEGR
ncbi:MAG: DUF2231 domain-containing protein [Thermoanaerobaculia bacterium]